MIVFDGTGKALSGKNGLSYSRVVVLVTVASQNGTAGFQMVSSVREAT